MVMQCNENWAAIVAEDIQIQALAAELKKAEAEDLVEEVCKEEGIGYHVRYFSDHQCHSVDRMGIMEH